MTESSSPPPDQIVDPLDDDWDEFMVSALEDCTGVLPAAAGQNAGTSSHAQSELVDGFDREAGQTWIYPTNKEIREYQLNIVRKALLQNTLVCLPTGLGKTFIAAVLMYNYYRWFPRAKVIFMAPTKPLVAQQMEACYEVMGIPQTHMSEMTGSMSPTVREAAWREKRVFFLTPQIISNDISRDICPANLVRCVVIDEAHKALGNHAYVQVIQELLKYNKGGFRVLALSATPGSVYQQVRQVIQNLLVANVEIRGEDSPDILPYTHSRVLETVVVPLSDELQEAKKRLVDVISVYVNRLHQRGCVARVNPEQLSQYAMFMERDRFRENISNTVAGFQRDMIEGDFAISISLFHALDLLQFYGLQSFHVYCQEMLQGGKGPSRTRYELQHNAMFCRLVDDVKRKLGRPIGLQRSPATSTSLTPPYKFTGYSHPKFQKLEEIVMAHFTDGENKESLAETRIIVFAQYRECVREIEAVLSRHKPQVRPVVLLGQGQGSAGSNGQQQGRGLKQKVQVQVMTQFRSGQYNVLVSTCIGEEGLDIGDVDLIICFDALKSPVRLVQRMGRTGRKRAGRVVILMTKGKEENAHKHGQYNSKAVSRSINSSKASYELYAANPRMIPADLEPVCHKMYLTCGTFIHEKSGRNFVSNPSKIRKLQIAETPYLTDGQLTEWKARYWLPTKDVPRLKLDVKMLSIHSPIKTLPENHSELFRQKSDRILSLTEWLPWQNVLQNTFVVGHSERTEIMVDTMKSLEVLQYQDGSQCEMDMASHLNMDDVLLPGEKESWRQFNIGGATKKTLIGSRTGGRGLVQRMWARHKRTITISSDEDDFRNEAIPPLKMESVEKSPLLVNSNDDQDFSKIDSTDTELGHDFFRILHKQTDCEIGWSSPFKKDGNFSRENGLGLHQNGSRSRPSVKKPPLPYAFGLLDEIDINFFSFLHEEVKRSVIPDTTASSNFQFKTPKLVKSSHAMVPMQQTPSSPGRNQVMNDSLYSMTQLLNIMEHNASDLAPASLSCSDQKMKSLSIGNRQAMIEAELENSNCDLDAAMLMEFEIIPPTPKRSPVITTRFSSKSIVDRLSMSTTTSTPLVQKNVATTKVKVSPDASSVSSSLSDEAFTIRRVQKRLLHRRLLNPSDFDSDSKTTVDPKAFLDDEASVDSETEQVSSDEISEEADSSDEAFINDATQGDGSNATMYLKSVKSPHCRPGAFKLFGAANGVARCVNDSVFSQLPSSQESDYEEDSFCVGSSDEESETILRPQKRRRIMVVNQDTSSSEEVDNRAAVKSLALIKDETASLNVATSLVLKTPLLCDPTPPVIILVDSQKIATSQNVISELRLKHKARVIIAQLGCCDYALGCRVAVETKAISDLINKAQHKKLLDRVRDMSANFERWILIVETGTPDVNSARSAFTSYVANMLVCLVDAGRVIFTNSKEHTAEVLYDLACSESKAGHALTLLTDPNNSAKFRFYRKLTSNNYVAALTLLDAFSSPNSLLQCSLEGIAHRCKWPVEKAETLYHNIHRNFNVGIIKKY